MIDHALPDLMRQMSLADEAAASSPPPPPPLPPRMERRAPARVVVPALPVPVKAHPRYVTRGLIAVAAVLGIALLQLLRMIHAPVETPAPVHAQPRQAVAPPPADDEAPPPPRPRGFHRRTPAIEPDGDEPAAQYRPARRPADSAYPQDVPTPDDYPPARAYPRPPPDDPAPYPQQQPPPADPPLGDESNPTRYR